MPTYEELLDLTRRQAGVIEALHAEVERLKKELEEAKRAGKRQAAPFSKGPPRSNPKRPGRKAGHPPSHRSTPSPEQFDRTIDVPLPPECPECHTPLADAPLSRASLLPPPRIAMILSPQAHESDPDERQDRRASPRWKRLGRWTPSVVSASLCVVLAICYVARPDACAAMTIFPPWAWSAPGLFLAAFNLRGRGNRKGWPVLAAWLIFLLALAEEPWSLGRALVRPGLPQREARPPGEVLRVISLNCAIGNRLAAEEVVRYRPDIVLLQESPGRREVEDLARRLFGTEAGVVHGVDASLVVHGRAIPAELPPAMRGYFVQSRVTLTTGRDIEVISTRLLPAVFRADLWSPDCWREQMENRHSRREQLGVIARRIGPITAPVIVGGDFNAPQGDAVFRLLRPKLHDAFSQSGMGWGNTIINDFPVLRIDQVWVSGAFKSEVVVARSTQNSDHRMVICDLILKD